jgi:hypothetical protein
VAVREEVFAVDRLNGKDGASRGDRSLTNAAASGWLHNMRRCVADGAVRMREAVGMMVCLLECGAEEEKGDAQDNEHEALTRLRCPALAHSLHALSILYPSEPGEMVAQLSLMINEV